MMKKLILSVLFFFLLLPVFFAFQEDFMLYQTKSLDVLQAGVLYDVPFLIKNTGAVASIYSLSLKGNASNFTTLNHNAFVLEPGEQGNFILFFNPQKGIQGSYDLLLTVKTAFDSEKTYHFSFDVMNKDNLYLAMKETSYQNLPCHDTVYVFSVTNVGSYDEWYTFSVEGFSPDEVRFGFPTLYIPAGATVQNTLTVTPSCEKWGWYKGVLKAKAEGSGYEKQLPFYLHLLREYPFSVSLGKYFQYNGSLVPLFNQTEENASAPYQICQKLGYRIPLKISNEFKAKNHYMLMLPKKSWIVANQTDLVVGPSQEKIIELLVFSDASLNETITLTITETLGGTTKQVNLSLQAENCYDYTITPQAKPVMCEDDKGISFIINNTGTKPLTLLLNSSGISLTSNVVSVNNSLSLLGHFPAINGTTSLDWLILADVIPYPQRFTRAISGKITVYPLDQCYVPKLDAFKTTIYYENTTKTVVMKNNGIKQATYLLTLEHLPAWVSLSNTSITLAPGEQQTVAFLITPPADAPDWLYPGNLTISVQGTSLQYTIPVSISLVHPHLLTKVWLWLNYHKWWGLLIFLILLFFIVLLYFLFTTLKSKRKPKVQRQAISLRKPAKKVPKKRKEKIPSSYESFVNDGWKIILSLLVLLFLIAVIIIFLKIDVWLIPQPINGTTTTMVSSTTLLAMNQTQEITNQSRLSSFVQELKDFRSAAWSWVKETAFFWKEHITEKEQELLGENTTTVSLVTSSTALTSTTTTLNLLNLTLEEAVSLAKEMNDESVLLQFLEEKHMKNSVLFQVWEMNTPHEFDLREHFYDPDEDMLYYSYTIPEHINVTVHDDIAYFYPEQNWHGVEEIIFKAEDAKGGQAVSPVIYLIVTQEKPTSVFWVFSVGNFIKQYLWYIINGVILLIIILLLLTPEKSKQQKQQQQQTTQKNQKEEQETINKE